MTWLTLADRPKAVCLCPCASFDTIHVADPYAAGYFLPFVVHALYHCELSNRARVATAAVIRCVA